MYQCKNCGYKGKKLVFQFTDYSYCVASNEDGPDFISKPPKWTMDEASGDTEIGNPVGCLKCHAWSSDNFEMV